MSATALNLQPLPQRHLSLVFVLDTAIGALFRGFALYPNDRAKELTARKSHFLPEFLSS